MRRQLAARDGMPHYGCGRLQSQGSPFTTGAKSPRADPAQTASLKHINFHPKTLRAQQQFVCVLALSVVTSEHSVFPRASPVVPITVGVFVFDGSAGS